MVCPHSSYRYKKEGNTLNVMTYIRYSVAFVFITSGLMKLLNEQLASTFIELGLPFPVYFMYLVALIELGCGFLILANKQVKKATMPLMLVMVAALILTKIPVLHSGLIAFAARLDIVMLVLLGLLYKQSYR